MKNLIATLLLLGVLSMQTNAQEKQDIKRIEFNSGMRGHHEQIVLTHDSVAVMEEDFTKDVKPGPERRTISEKEWSKVLASLKGVRLSEIETLQSPTMKRAYDAAAHGSIIITDAHGTTYAHGFDDENPHKKLQPLMSEIRKFRKK